ncbi:unnamed protein product, partial [Ectocarpus sp. 12 AP-2014]
LRDRLSPTAVASSISYRRGTEGQPQYCLKMLNHSESSGQKSIVKKDAGTDLVDAGMFLRGCREPMEQYREGLVRQKLSAVKIHQLGQMNITRFDHQKLIMDRIRHLSDIPSMARYSVGKANVAEVEAAVHVAPRRKGNSSNTGSSSNTNRVLSGESVSSGSLGENASQSDASMSEETGEGGKKSKGHHRRRSTRHGLGIKGGRR